jgi:RNA polymerase sigma-70 factor, ECF subfamily
VSRRDVDWGDLMRAANQGDAIAYNRLLVSLLPVLRSIARSGLARAGLPVAEAEDIVQETMLAIHLKRHTWDSAAPIAPWIHAIARNKLIDSMRRKGRRNHVPIDDFAEILPSEAAEPMPIPARLDGHLEELPGRQRDVVRAISVDGASIRETAERLSMSEGAVRVALHRGLASLALRFERREA